MKTVNSTLPQILKYTEQKNDKNCTTCWYMYHKHKNSFNQDFIPNIIPFIQLHFNNFSLTLIPLGYFEDLSPLGGGADLAPPPPPQISATNGPIDSKIGSRKTSQVELFKKIYKNWTFIFFIN